MKGTSASLLTIFGATGDLAQRSSLRAVPRMRNASGSSGRSGGCIATAAADPQRYPIAAILHAPGALLHLHWSP